jgi:hypothetical protein
MTEELPNRRTELCTCNTGHAESLPYKVTPGYFVISNLLALFILLYNCYCIFREICKLFLLKSQKVLHVGSWRHMYPSLIF